MECIRSIKTHSRRSKVIALAGPKEVEPVFQAFQAGADGCLSKDDLKSIYRRLGVHSRAEALVIFLSRESAVEPKDGS